MYTYLIKYKGRRYITSGDNMVDAENKFIAEFNYEAFQIEKIEDTLLINWREQEDIVFF